MYYGNIYIKLNIIIIYYYKLVNARSNRNTEICRFFKKKN